MTEQRSQIPPVNGESEDRFRDLLDTAGIGMALVSADGLVLRANRALAQMLGKEAEDLRGRATLEFTHPQDAEADFALYRELIDGRRESYRIEKRYLRSDGEVIRASLTVSLLRDAAGRPRYALALVEDMTERLRTEQELRSSRGQLELILRAVQDGITVQDGRGALVYANDAAARLIGFDSAADLLATPVSSILGRFEIRDPEGQPFPLDQLPGRRALRGEQPASELLQYAVTGSDRTSWSVVSASAVHDDAGRPILAVNVFHDVSERMQREQELRERQQQLEALTAELEATIDELQARTEEAEVARAAAEWAAERSRFLAEASRALSSSLDFETTLAAMARLAVPRMADWCVIDLVDEQNELRRLEVAHTDPAQLEIAHELQRRYPPRPDLDQGVFRVIRTGSPELYARIPDELLVSVAQDADHLRMLRGLGLRSAMVVPMVAHDRTLGAITFVAAGSGRSYTADDLGMAEDLARRAATAIENARLFRDAQTAHAEADAANRSKSQFLAVMSHELRTPLNAIIGYEELLLLGLPEPLPASARARVERIGAAAQHLLHLIEGILTFSRLDAGHADVHAETFDLTTVVKDVAQITEPLARQKGLDFKVRMDAPIVVRTDARKVRQILLNLISNAIKFTDAGLVELHVEVDNDRVWLNVRDTGIGIEASHLDHIFEPFRQLEVARTRRASGTGLGLSVTRSLARLLHGDVSVISSPGSGSTFRCNLPLRY